MGPHSATAAGLRTLPDLGDVAGQRIVVRVDFNVPLDGAGGVTNDTRIALGVPTLRMLRERGARLVVVSHLGRPRDREPGLSLRPVAARLAELLGEDVVLAQLADPLPDAGVVMLENIR